MNHSNMIMITCVIKAKENTRVILLYEKVQLNVYKRLFDNEYLISIHGSVPTWLRKLELAI